MAGECSCHAQRQRSHAYRENFREGGVVHAHHRDSAQDDFLRGAVIDRKNGPYRPYPAQDDSSTKAAGWLAWDWIWARSGHSLAVVVRPTAFKARQALDRGLIGVNIPAEVRVIDRNPRRPKHRNMLRWDARRPSREPSHV